MSVALVHCGVDDWDFDPRYTDGACPICGAAAEDVAALPRWLRVSRRVPWDVVGLLALFFVCVVLGKLALQAAGMWPPVHVPPALHRFL